MILFIDTTDFNSVTFTVAGKKKQEEHFKLDSRESHKLLETLDKFLKKNRIPNAQIKEIIACSGPGSYTGVRVGLAQAQALGLGWGVPVKTFKKTQFDELVNSHK